MLKISEHPTFKADLKGNINSPVPQETNMLISETQNYLTGVAIPQKPAPPR
jgi:hypothetical protein